MRPPVFLADPAQLAADPIVLSGAGGPARRDRAPAEPPGSAST